MNYTEEQIKKALRVFIDDPQTAKKFAEAMRKGLEIAEMENEPHPFETEEDADEAVKKYYVEEICTYKRGAFVEANSPEEAEDAYIEHAMNPDTDLDIYGDNTEYVIEGAKK